MRSKLRLVLISGVSVASLLLASCVGIMTGPMNKNVKDNFVKLEVPKKAGSNIKIKKGKTKCPSGSRSEYGCLELGLDEEGVVKFSISSKTRGMSYHVTEMIICRIPKNGNKDSPQDCSFTDQTEQDQFAVMEMGGLTRYHPDAKGAIKFSRIARRLSEFKFINLNTFEQDYFYTIKACDAGNTDCRETDPLIKNGGRQL